MILSIRMSKLKSTIFSFLLGWIVIVGILKRSSEYKRDQVKG